MECIVASLDCHYVDVGACVRGCVYAEICTRKCIHSHNMGLAWQTPAVCATDLKGYFCFLGSLDPWILGGLF